MALVTVEDVQARTGETYQGTELARVNAFIEDVSALIGDFVATLGGSIPDPTPGSVKAVAVMEVRRYLNTDPGVYTERVDVISDSFAYQGAAVALSPGAEDSLKRWIRSTRKGLRTIQLVRPECWDEATGTVTP